MSTEAFDVWTSDSLPAPFPHEQAIEAYGVRIAMGASDRELLGRVAAVHPPCARPCEPAAVGGRFGLVRDEVGYNIVANGFANLGSPDLEIAVGLLDVLVRNHVAQLAPDRVFLHAGVVAHEGRAIVLPGLSMSGKTTLVAELVRAGATYYSEEYAVLERDGMVHPYPKRLSIRAEGIGIDTPVESLGGVAGVEPVRAGLVAVTSYSPGAVWRPSQLPPAQGVLAVLSHSLVARERPEESLVAATALAAGAVVLVGDRGEAKDLAPRLLAALEGSLAEDPDIPLP